MGRKLKKMPDEKLEIRLYRNDSPRDEALEQAIRQMGYKVKTIISSAKEPTISTKTLYAHGYVNILSSLGLI